MMTGQSNNAYYMKELMRLMPTAHKKSREMFEFEKELRGTCMEERAERVREVKIMLYDFKMDCRQRNRKYIQSAPLNMREMKLLWLRFVKGGTWKEIFNTQGFSPDHCKRIHRDAVAKIAGQYKDVDFKVLYEREKARLDQLLKNKANEKECGDG